MPLTFRADITSEREQIQRLVRQAPQTRKEILTQIGFALVSKQRQHFQQLSRTGSANGVTWKRQAPQTLIKRLRLQRQGRLAAGVSPADQGILSGNTAGSFFFSVRPNAVRLMAGQRTAAGLLMSTGRPVFPATIPASWADSAERVTQSQLDRYYR